MRHSDINLTMNIYTHTLAGQEAAAVATMPNFDTAPTKQQQQQATALTNAPPNATDATAPTGDAPATADTTPTNTIDRTFTENFTTPAPPTPTAAPATNTNNPMGTLDNAPKPIENPPADTTAIPPKTDTKNSPPNSPERAYEPCRMLGKSEGEPGESNVIAEGTKKDENIVKVELFPVKSPQPSSDAELQNAKSEIQGTKFEINFDGSIVAGNFRFGFQFFRRFIPPPASRSDTPPPPARRLSARTEARRVPWRPELLAARRQRRAARRRVPRRERVWV